MAVALHIQDKQTQKNKCSVSTLECVLLWAAGHHSFCMSEYTELETCCSLFCLKSGISPYATCLHLPYTTSTCESMPPLLISNHIFSHFFSLDWFLLITQMIAVRNIYQYVNFLTLKFRKRIIHLWKQYLGFFLSDLQIFRLFGFGTLYFKNNMSYRCF